MSSSAERQEQRIRLGLIAYVTQHTIDQDYAWVSSNRPAAGGGRRSRIAAVVVLALFALLIFTAASQTSRNSSSTEIERNELIAQVNNRRDALNERTDRVEALTRTNSGLRSELVAQAGGSLSTTVGRLSLATGAGAVSGPGVMMVADDKPGADSDRQRVLDRDLQRLVNGLWTAGAQAVSINAQRISNLTSIREAGGTINVNYVPLRAPYTVRAIGDPNTLASRFANSTSGASWFDLVQQVGLRLQITTAKQLTLPASDEFMLRYAKPAKGDGP